MKKVTLLLIIMLILKLANLYPQSANVVGDNQINKCETKQFTINFVNNSGNSITDIVVTNDINNLVGFGYVTGTTSISINGGAPFCSTDPTITSSVLSWDIDNQCSPSFTLNNGQTLNVSFSLESSCEAVSGSQNIKVYYKINGNLDSTSTNFSIEVLPGGITINKTPNVIPQYVGENVTWTISVKNTGFGTIKNVVVTDVIGDGLTYVSSTPAGNNSGQVTSWGPAEIPALALMNPDETVSIEVTVQVTSCENLESYADARWGCDMSTDCYNTATDGGTATAAVQRLVRTPLISYSPPDVNFDYCQNQQSVNFTFYNTGDGTAYDIKTFVDFGNLTVSDVSSGAVYNDVEKRFELQNPIPPGGSYDLSFNLNFNSWCTDTPDRELIWRILYEDECGNAFYPTAALSSISGPAQMPSISLTLTGAPAEIQIGDQVTYTINSSYSGPLSCDGNSMSDITVTDTIPDGFTVINSGGGTWTPGPGGSGGTITWTYSPTTSFSSTILLQAPEAGQCEDYCFTTFENVVTAIGIDCCGCTREASASQTTAIECEELVSSSKSASPSIVQRCENINYTNTYNFGIGASTNLNELSFEEHADYNQQYVTNSLTVNFNGADITSSVIIINNTPGGSLLLDFSNCPAEPVANKVLTINYQLTITEATVSACSGLTFYSWSSLDMGSSGSECLVDGIIHETTQVTVQAPAMSVSLSGMDNILNKCQEQDIVITVTQNSDVANPKDVKLVLSGLNYYIIDPAATVCSGVAPISCTPTIIGDDYVWEFGDAFTGAGQSSEISISVKKRCNDGDALQATVYFDDNCNDDANSDEICSASATAAPILLISGDLLIEKTPEVYHAVTNTAAWSIYVTNRGEGAAYNVWVDDELGAGLEYQNAIVDDMTGVLISPNIDHEGSAINGVNITIDEMAPGERRQITLTARLISCDDLTNVVTTNWGCGGSTCQSNVTDQSYVNILSPLLINTNTVTTPIDICENLDGYITLKNAGKTTCYNLQITETLDTGLSYVPGSTRWRINGGPWFGPSPSYDPSPMTSPLRWTSSQIPALAVADVGEIIEIEFDLAANCQFDGGDVVLSTQYENPCGNVFTNADSRFSVSQNQPKVNIDITGPSGPISCNENITWTITATNNSGYTLPILWIEDIIGSGFSFISSTGDATYGLDNGFFDGVNKVQWEFINIPNGATVTLTVTASSDAQPCDNGLSNNVYAYWGCGTPDGSSATKPGQDPPDDDLCLSPTSFHDSITHTRRPSISVASIEMNPSTIDQCGSSSQISVTIQNTGDTDGYDIDLRIRLTDALEYVTGSATLNFGGSTVAIADPAISGNYLYFYNITNDATGKSENLIDILEASGGNDTAILTFSVESHCYTTSSLQYRVYFYDCCENNQYYATKNKSLNANSPSLELSITPASSQVECGETQTWTITVTNNGNNTAQVVRLEDTLSDWIEYISSNPPATFMGGNTYGWEFNNLEGNGGDTSFTITGRLNPSTPREDCSSSHRQNNARAIWGCGNNADATDGDPTTQNYDCSYGSYSNASPATLKMPDLVILSITPSTICNADGDYQGSVTVRVKNQGDGDCTSAFTLIATDGQGWTGSESYNQTIPANSYVDIVVNDPQWQISCAACGPYTFSAEVDKNDDVCECNESNNSFGTVNYSLEIADLSVSDIDFSNLYIVDNNFVGHIDVTVENNGCADAGSFDVSLQTEGTLTFTPKTVTALAAGSQTIVSFEASGPWTDCGGPGCVFTATADASDLECECNAENNVRQEPFAGPTNIELISFTAEPNENGIIIKWSTASEPDNAGFNLYRSISEFAGYQKINPTLIPSKGNATAGADYSFTDIPPGENTYYYKLQDIDLQGRSSYHGPISVTLTGINTKNRAIPDKYSLSQNHPNPFNPETTINYGLPKATFVELNIFDVNGHLVRTLEYGYKQAGFHSIIWDGKNEAGNQVASGIYLYILRTADFCQTKKMVMMK